MSDDLKHERQQMLMARPWHAAELHSIWEITGIYPGRKGRFTTCLAQVVWVEDGAPLFRFLGLLGAVEHDVVRPHQITAARPLLLVLRDEPSTAYFVDDQEYVTGGAS